MHRITFDPNWTSFMVIKIGNKAKSFAKCLLLFKSQVTFFITKKINSNKKITTLKDNAENALDDYKPTHLPFIRS